MNRENSREKRLSVLSWVSVLSAAVAAIGTVLIAALLLLGSSSKTEAMPPMALERHSAFEPNDTQVEAYGPIVLGHMYDAPADDTDDWYYFDLETETSIGASVKNFVSKGQLVIYKADPAQDPPREYLAHHTRETDDQAPEMWLPTSRSHSLDKLAAGRYYIRINNEGGADHDRNYHLKVFEKTTPGGSQAVGAVSDQSASGRDLGWLPIPIITTLITSITSIITALIKARLSKSDESSS